jgi:hypothetical protein
MKYYKYAFDQTNLTQFTLSFHGFAYVEPLRKTLIHFFFRFFVVLNKVVDVLNAKKILYIEGVVEHFFKVKALLNIFSK